MEDRKTVQRLKDAISNQDDELAEKLVQRLIDDDEAALIELASAESGDYKWWAVRSLAHVGTPACITTVAENLECKDSAIRAACTLAIAHLYKRHPDEVRETIPALTAMLTDDDGLVRQSAADALAMCGNDAVEALGQVIDSLHDGARARAAYSLRKIATKEAAALLIPLLDDPNHLVRSYAYDGVEAAGAFDDLVIKA